MTIEEVTNIVLQDRTPQASACFQEAVNSLNANAPRAAMVMARAALELTLEYAGFTENRLVDKIPHAIRQLAMDNADQAQAEMVRLIGNVGAHGDLSVYVPLDVPMTQPIAEAAIKVSFTLALKVLQWKEGGTA